MIDTSDNHRRRSIRLPCWDYSHAGAYFVTICTRTRECLFGNVENGEMQLTDAGQAIIEEWLKIPEIRKEVQLDEWVVMPNHFHGIMVFKDDAGAIHETPSLMTVQRRRVMALSKLMGRFKMLSAKRINKIRQTSGSALWQRNYYEHVIRNELDLHRIREYITANPAQWEMDELHPQSIGRETNRGDS